MEEKILEKVAIEESKKKKKMYRKGWWNIFYQEL